MPRAGPTGGFLGASLPGIEVSQGRNGWVAKLAAARANEVRSAPLALRVDLHAMAPWPRRPAPVPPRMPIHVVE